MIGAFGFQALGALTGVAVGVLVLDQASDLNAWRWMYATAIIPAIVVAAGRFFCTGKPHLVDGAGSIQPRQLRSHTPAPS